MLDVLLFILSIIGAVILAGIAIVIVILAIYIIYLFIKEILKQERKK